MAQPPHPSGLKRLRFKSLARLPPGDVLHAHSVAKQTEIVKRKVDINKTDINKTI
jgi:hypothetical protein